MVKIKVTFKDDSFGLYYVDRVPIEEEVICPYPDSSITYKVIGVNHITCIDFSAFKKLPYVADVFVEEYV